MSGRMLVRAMTVLVILGATVSAHATIISSLVGDKDGFGGFAPNAVQTTGSWSDFGPFFVDNRDVGDPLFTDIWSSATSVDTMSPIGYTHSYVLDGPALLATLFINEAGMADARGPWNVEINSTSIGQIGVFPGPSSEFALLSFSVPVGLLTGSDTVTLTYLDTLGEGFAINFSELVIETGTVPEPGTIALLTFGLAWSFVHRRRRGR